MNYKSLCLFRSRVKRVIEGWHRPCASHIGLHIRSTSRSLWCERKEWGLYAVVVAPRDANTQPAGRCGSVGSRSRPQTHPALSNGVQSVRCYMKKRLDPWRRENTYSYCTTICMYWTARLVSPSSIPHSPNRRGVGGGGCGTIGNIFILLSPPAQQQGPKCITLSGHGDKSGRICSRESSGRRTYAMHANPIEPVPNIFIKCVFCLSCWWLSFDLWSAKHLQTCRY